jgi:hypothetical protein
MAEAKKKNQKESIPPAGSSVAILDSHVVSFSSPVVPNNAV